ncbi:hypothetical protein HPB51_025160 [Rhipicephalus microplus]|uniref:Peptidase A2 domain-containing protein n=1 Tax=Rhipicephalus microplus TaxID=6941 RepID=A0A9J6EJF0_RHIMP|nr:hypothetical protein HPB51_025160 [Rhipicephalus microplus]
MSIHVEGIGDLSARVDTGPEQTALYQRHAPDTIRPWTQPLLCGLGGSAMPVGMLDISVRMAAGTKVLPAIPIFEDLPADMILGADFLLSHEIELTIHRGHIELWSSTAGTTATTLPPPSGPQCGRM